MTGPSNLRVPVRRASTFRFSSQKEDSKLKTYLEAHSPGFVISLTLFFIEQDGSQNFGCTLCKRGIATFTWVLRFNSYEAVIHNHSSHSTDTWIKIRHITYENCSERVEQDTSRDKEYSASLSRLNPFRWPSTSSYNVCDGCGLTKIKKGTSLYRL